MFNPTRLKVQLKLSINRLKMLQAKKTSLNQQNRREIGTLLEKGKEESARIRVEHIIRDDLLIEAMESLELYCDLLLARFGLLETYKTCDPSIAEAVNTIIWAAPRVGEVKELGLVRDQLASKFGKEFMMQALENTDEQVNPRIVLKLQVNAPDSFLVERYLEEIARTYDIKWRSSLIEHEQEEEDEEDEELDDDSDSQHGSGGQAENPTTEDDAQFDLPEIPTTSPLKKPMPPPTQDDPNDFDALARHGMAVDQDIVESLPEEEVMPAPVLVHDATFKSTSVALIEKLLQFSTPRLDSKIVNVLFLEGMMDIFMTHVSRLDLQADKIELEKCSVEQKLKYSKHKRDMEDMAALKRSYHAMEFLSGTTANHLWVQNAKFYDIVNHLFEVFLPNSHGNFNHFFKIFQHLVRRHPCDMLDFVILRNNASIVFHYMLPYLTEGSVMDALLTLLFVRDINPETKEQREKSHERLYELGFLEWMVKAMQLKSHPDYVEAMQEFFIRVIEEASQVDNGDILLKALRTDKGKDIMEILVKQTIHNAPSEERERTITIIKLLVKSGMLTTRTSSLSQPVQGPLYFVSLRSQDLLIEYIAEFCHLFIKDRKDKNTKERPLTTSDMDLLDIIYQTLYNANEKVEMLASIPSAFWKILTNSFFEKSTMLVRKQSLITRMIDAYQSKQKTDNRGFILLILNQLRLMADARHSALINRTMAEHPRYQEFLPTLRKDTLAQTESIYAWKLEACPRPPAHIGPTPPIQSVQFSPYASTLPLMTNANDHDEAAAGIDLGSDFAYCLGFKETENGIETPYEYLSRRNSDHSIIQEPGSEEEEYDCPLCMEELDIADRNFKPCPCGYKICRFCWHHIRENLNGRCPACRREYSDQNAEFEPISADEIARIKREKKEKERQQKEMEMANRRHLANMRVVQKNLVYIIGLHPKLATEETIRSPDYFGQFGKIAKIVINKRQIAPTSHANGATSMQPSAAVYVTYNRKEDATKAIHAVDGSVMAGRILRASYGTTKYCTYYLRNMNCPNPNCLYLHEPGEDADTISKEELATGKHHMRDQMSQDTDNEDHEDHEEDVYSPSSRQYSSPSLSNSDFPPVSLARKLEDERSALPATASWGKTSTPGTPIAKHSPLPSSSSSSVDRTALTPDAFGPPLAVAVAQQQQQQQQKQPLSPTVLKRKLEKKKRKEMLAKQRKEEAAAAQTTMPSPPPTTMPLSQKTTEHNPFQHDGLVNFVLGRAFDQVCLPTQFVQEEEDIPVGVSALYDFSSSSSTGSEDISLPQQQQQQQQQQHLIDVLNMDKMNLTSNGVSPLEFLTHAMPTPTYMGTFNPFAHQLLRSPQQMASSLPNVLENNTSSGLFDSPVRKTSRFGFAQF
ncbi:regulator of Vps4 activity in the MVB pathway-domain-containing protein [Gilbertella persicaria]|uniref:regulator of Vps4 activity in the MVB pathway-domain-containing protein n=1 Tax=Gilbertella persicaria TaxID=101096 RepID=UPI0022208024|nr:regulator of Vps4 activity in the MVB pathway-domain-containing protein [Gilbertella persicaria]KAI8095106.1 regulator of Vps4 activity in the MVB pathway-domain-containing protein [Gilbertella persicaria]